jgi:hypothetical protein
MSLLQGVRPKNNKNKRSFNENDHSVAGRVPDNTHPTRDVPAVDPTQDTDTVS